MHAHVNTNNFEANYKYPWLYYEIILLSKCHLHYLMSKILLCYLYPFQHIAEIFSEDILQNKTEIHCVSSNFENCIHRGD